MGHGCTIFDEHTELGGMMRYGIPGYRTPRDVLDGEIQRIIDMGVELRMGTRIGSDVTLAEIEEEYDAVFWGIGAHTTVNESDRPEYVVLGQTAHDVASAAKREGAEVMLITRRDVKDMPAAQKEIEDALREGVEIRGNLAPVGVVMGDDGRAVALRVAEMGEVDGKRAPVPGTEYDIDADLIVSAIGQVGDFSGFEEFDNGKGLMNSDRNYRSPQRPNHFVAGDILRPHLLTTAIGQARIAVDGIDQVLQGADLKRRPKYEGVRFNMLNYLKEHGKELAEQHGEVRGTDDANFAIHNFEDRSANEVIPHDKLFLGHFNYEARNKRDEVHIGADEVLGNFEERLRGYLEEQAVAEAKRCMSCGQCFECDACVVYCPQDAVYKNKKSEQSLGRYVDTWYDKCIGDRLHPDGTRRVSMLRLLSALLLLLATLPATAAEEGGRVPLPVIDSGTAEQCVEPVEFMRRNHMELILHQRDETVHRGIRTKQQSLRNCINCHAVDAAGQPVSLDDPQHFCVSCHRYAAVKIDCFQCHSGTPEEGVPGVTGAGAWSHGLAMESAR
jgi:Pyruvate/2-oxoacid:ferredoxin oxidoreductase delta subunit